MEMGFDYYEILGLPSDASPEEIRRAYRSAAQRLHPDKNINSGETELFIKIQEAYDNLSMPERRSLYDKKLIDGSSRRAPVDIQFKYSREAIERLAEQQLFYVLLELTARPEAEDTSNPPINVCLVLDSSTSMKGKLIDTVKYTAIELVRQLRKQDILSIVAFSDRAEVIVRSGSNLERNQVESSIRRLQANGGTEILQGLEAGFKEVYRSRSTEYVNHIILLTDGRTYGDEDFSLKIAADAANLGIGISCLGIGNKWNVAFLENLAALTGGNCMYVSKPEDIHRFLKEKFNQLSRSYADNITYKFRPGPNIKLVSAFRLQPEASSLETDTPLRLGNLPINSEMRVLFEFEIGDVPPGQDYLSLAEGYLAFDIPRHKLATYTTRLQFKSSTIQILDTKPPPPEIIEALSQLNLYRMQERARRDVVTGNFSEAAQRLEFLAKQLFSSGEVELAQTVLLEADHVQKNKSLSEEGEKLILYGTRALLLPSLSSDSRFNAMQAENQ